MKELIALLLVASSAATTADVAVNSKASYSVAQTVIYETEFANSKYELIELENICQKPELPTGCEVTALTTVLNYLGYDVDKCTLADEYLHKEKPGMYDFSTAFMGEPRLLSGFGCYSPVICDCAEKYIASVDGTHTVSDISGSTPDELYEQIFKGNPVIVWATDNMSNPVMSKVWTKNGVIPWQLGEHCLVLVGYDKEKNIVYMADPLKKGITAYNKNLFEQRYSELGSQAVIIT